jgi:arsenate reductase
MCNLNVIIAMPTQTWGENKKAEETIMTHKPFHVLFVCHQNAGRSILAEAAMRHRNNPLFVAHSAGDCPADAVDPMALQLLQGVGYDTTGLQPKDWHMFAQADSPEMDFIITTCDIAAGEPCPDFAGAPLMAHWGMPDPAQVEGSPAAKHEAYAETLAHLNQAIDILMALPPEKLDKASVHARLQTLGQGNVPHS